MSVSPARKIAYKVLRRVESGRVFAAALLQGREVSALKEVDRRLATELVMGVLRWSGALDHMIEQLSKKPLKYFDPEVLTILRLGVYQIRFLERIPRRAATNDAVELTKLARKSSATGLVNAVLRKCPMPAARGVRKDSAPDLEMACRTLPAWLLQRWSRSFGAEAAKSLAWESTAVPPTTLRVISNGREEIQRELAEEGIKTRPGPYSRLALTVESGSVQASRAFREGRVVIQDEGSQLVAELVRPEPGSAILDICAAPGIKTGQLAQALGRGRLVASDLSARRLATMQHLLGKAIPEGVRFSLVRIDAARELPLRLKFDRVLLDAPCSGTGTLARNPEIKLRLEPGDVTRLAETQSRMLRAALDALAPGGRLIYATCSLEPEENERVVEAALERKGQYRLLTRAKLSQDFPALAPFFDARGYFRTRPDLHSMDGFVAAVIARAV